MTPVSRRLMAGVKRVMGIFARERRDRELAAELQSHFELHVEDNLRAGMSPEDAHRAAVLKFGPVESIKETYRDRAGVPSVDAAARDVRYALRVLRRHQAFSLAAIATLTLGIAASAAVFSIVDAVFLRPLPYADPERVVGVKGSEGQSFVIFGPNITLQDRFRDVRTFAPLAIYARGGLNLGGESAQRLRAAAVSPEFFSALGLAMTAGRPFTADDVARDERVAVIGHRLWREQLGGKGDIIGGPLVLNGRSFTVLGVMPPGATFPEQSQIWIPAAADGQMLGTVAVFALVGRLSPGSTPQAAWTELIHLAGFTGPQAEALEVLPMREALVGDIRPIAGFVGAAAALVLLVACINAANLLLARVAAREREFAVRRAIGATRGQLMRQVLVESLVLSALAGTAAIPVAFWLLGLATALLPPGLHGIDAISMGIRALTLIGAMSLLTAVIFGIAPSLSIRRAASGDLLRGAQSTTMDRLWQRFRSGLLVAEIAIALLLLAGASTLAGTVFRLMRIDTGATGERALVMELTLPRASYEKSAQIKAFHGTFDASVRGIPGVEQVGMTSQIPGVAPNLLMAEIIAVQGHRAPPGRRKVAIRLTASPGYFDALGISFIAGRTFSDGGIAGSPREVIVSEGYARIAGLRPEELIGREASWGGPRDSTWATIVGVVRDVRINGPEQNFAPAIYGPAASDPRALQTAFVVVKAAGRPEALVPAIRRAVSTLDPNLPLYNVRSYADVRASTFAERRFAMVTMGAFAALAFALATVGLYGVIAYLVQLRTREIGIRLAIGATPSHVRRDVLRTGLAHGAAGVLVGGVAAAALSRISIASLPGVSRLELDTLAWLAAGVLVVALGATWIPARRATRVNPILTLKAE